MSAIEKTEGLERKMVPIEALIPNEENPNEMTDAEFNLLYDNMEQVGFTDAVLVKALDDGTYRIVGGHHRWEVAKLIGFEEVPVTVITDAQFDEDQERFQLVRHNVIKGKMSPQKFLKLYEQMADKYAEDILIESFGFANEEEFRRLVKKTAENLPNDMKSQFLEAAEEIRTIDELSTLLNKLFTVHGDSLPYGYMFLDFGGQDSIWLRMEKATKKSVEKVAQICRENSRTMDSVVGGMMALIAAGELDDALGRLIAAAPVVEIPEGMTDMPTLDYLDKFNDSNA